MNHASRAIVVLGMHRSGTSAIARGTAALGVDLGNDFLDAQPENPTGYWEDRDIVELNERVLKLLGLAWDALAPIDPNRFGGWRMWRLRREARRALARRFTAKPLWGFKDPRTVRLLPFWLRVLRESRVKDAYLLAIRNPASVAASLHARQEMDVETARRLWLVNVAPFLDELEAKPFAVVDYDLLMRDPRGQLDRLARKLAITAYDSHEVERFAGEFLDATLRHSVFTLDDIETSSKAGRLTREAYGLLYGLASDRVEPDERFWADWRKRRFNDRLWSEESSFDGRGKRDGEAGGHDQPQNCDDPIGVLHRRLYGPDAAVTECDLNSQHDVDHEGDERESK